MSSLAEVLCERARDGGSIADDVASAPVNVERLASQQIDLRALELVDCSFENKDFSGSTLARTRFSRCNFERCTFDRCDLSSTVFESCVIVGTEFGECSLTDAEFRDTEFAETDFAGSSLAGTVFLGCSVDEGTNFWSHSAWDDVFWRRLRASVSHYPAALPGESLGACFVRWIGALYCRTFPDAQCAYLLEEVEGDWKAAEALYRQIYALRMSSGEPIDAATTMFLRSRSLLCRPLGIVRVPLSWLNYLVTGFMTSARHLVAAALAIIVLFASYYSENELYLVRASEGAGRQLVFQEALYFSGVTFATLGYGDISPNLGTVERTCRVARCRFQILLPAVEALLGAIFMALLVAVLARLSTASS